MKRRQLLIAGAALAAAAPATAQDHEHMHQQDETAAAAGGHHGHHGPLLVKNPLLVEAASKCVNTAQTCLSHCLMMFAKGDTTLAECARKVNELQAACTALLELTNMDSQYLSSYAKVTMQVCRDCEKECRKHADEHEVCKACAEACLACYDECDIIST